MALEGGPLLSWCFISNLIDIFVPAVHVSDYTQIDILVFDIVWDYVFN